MKQSIEICERIFVAHTMLRTPNAISFPISQIRSTFARVDVFHHWPLFVPIHNCNAFSDIRFVNWPHVSTKGCAFEWVMLTLQKKRNRKFEGRKKK